ncbi:MAG: proline--tRNA ligase [Acidobacteriota bacterium]
MRWSRYYLFTTREVPSDAEVVSHQLMARAGMIRKLAAGIYTYLPLGWRSIYKMMRIVRREMEAAGAVELMMPAIQPAELWRESDRWDVFGDLLLRIEDRNQREFCFGPTHEEVVTDIVRRDVRSYRQLPLNLYQIQNKFRDEIRPRFGLMRGREFLMKDAYSFHADDESMDEVYEAMRQAYCDVFEDCRLEYEMVEAASGAIGGSASHEFMVLADTGEDVVVSCSEGDYAANVEKAESTGLRPPDPEEPDELREVATPGMATVVEVTEFLKVTAQRLVKTLIYDTESGPVAALVRGDREINELKLASVLGVSHLRLADDRQVVKLTGAPVGFAGPLGIDEKVRIVADLSTKGLINFICGANKKDTHFVGVNWERDLQANDWADILLVTEGDPCPRCGGTLELHRGIEVGHIFKLGTKYSEAMGCSFLDADGKSHPMIMGCYGLGIGRTVAVLALSSRDDQVTAAADRLYDELTELGVEVFYDDRDERPGVKFKDADLIGIPVRIAIGSKSLAEGKVELSMRRDREKHLLDPSDVAGRVSEILREE